MLFNYADDNTLFYSCDVLEKLLAVIKKDTEIVVHWFKENGMQANPEKFQFTVSHRTVPCKDIEIQILNTVIKSSDSVQLLGLKIDSLLTFDDHVIDICKKAGKQINV